MSIADQIRHLLSSRFSSLAVLTIVALSLSSLSMVVYAEDKALDADGDIVNTEVIKAKSQLHKERVQTYLEDTQVTAKVKNELFKDDVLKSIDISVETHKGQVILSGFVENGEQLLRAVHIASGVDGVQSVKNALVIKG